MDMLSLFPPQQAVLDHGIPDLGFSSVLSLPTGSGKTTLAEIAMERALAKGESVAYLTPLKALAEEKSSTWRDRWSGYKVGIFTGDYSSGKTKTTYKEADVLICTYEKLDSVLRHWRRHLDWLAKLGLVVVDEFHLLTDPSRGARLEGAISRLRRVNPFCRLMGMSATISNHAEVAKWLDGVSYHSTWRPVPIKHEVRRFSRLQDKATLVHEIVAQTSKECGQSLVFVSSRRRAEELAAQVSQTGIPTAHHHAGLTLTRRQNVEARFRSGALHCLVTTPTLEMGLNLPCRTVVIADNTQWNGETFAPLPIWNYLQRAGRAGRPGQDGEGRAILLAPKWARTLLDYARATPEPVTSKISQPSNLAEQILIEVASRSCRTRDQLVGTFLPSTLAFRQQPSSIDKKVSDCLTALVESHMLNENSSGLLHPTPVGWSAVRNQIRPSTVGHLLKIEQLKDSGHWSDFDLLLHHCWDINLQPRLPISIEVVDLLEDHIQEIPSVLMDQAPPTHISPKACAAGVLMSSLAWSFIQDHDVGQICSELDIYESDAAVLRNSLVRLLKASADIHTAYQQMDMEDQESRAGRLAAGDLSTRLDKLALQLEYGLPGDAAYLTRIPGCGGTLARRMFKAGITDLEELCIQEPTNLSRVPGIGLKRAHAWIKAAEDLMKVIEFNPSPSPPVITKTHVVPSDWPAEIDPGRLQRSVALEVTAFQDGYRVTGGAEEHLVSADSCDCADYMKNGNEWWCKHRLAVRLRNRDKLLTRLASRLSDIPRPTGLRGNLASVALGRNWKDD
jgi:helicase